jgi:hypothetical protein
MWQPLETLLGTWRGTGTGQSGESIVTRSYKLVLRDRFIEVRNRSEYARSEANPAGEVHEDWGLISFDGQRQCYVLRQFHVEGFVNQYVMRPAAESGGPEPREWVFMSEAIENIPAGWRARERIAQPTDDDILERFDLAAPGADFELYVENRLRRVD